MPTPRILTVTRRDVKQTATLLALAFANDPVVRAFFPDPLDHVRHFAKLMRINLLSALVSGTAFYVEGFRAATIWFPPVLSPRTRRTQAAREARMSAFHNRVVSREGKDDLFAALTEVRAAHPKEPHWYLLSIGADPHHQNEGLGSLLMKHMLPRCDAEGIFTYLESSNPRNVPFYERHGFQTWRVVQVGRSPTFTLMMREPR